MGTSGGVSAHGFGFRFGALRALTLGPTACRLSLQTYNRPLF